MKVTQIQPDIANPHFGIPASKKIVENRYWKSHSRIHQDPSDTSRKPLLALRGGACLERILSDIHVKLELGEDCSIYLYIIDDIDFDCSQPFLARVLEELVTNAVTAAGKCAMRQVDVLATQYKGRLYMQVADNGLGIPDDIVCWFEGQHNEPAHLAARSGLARVAKLINQAGGQLSLVNSGSNGTRVGFSLPLEDTAEDAGYGRD